MYILQEEERTRKMCREDDPGSSSAAAERVIPEGTSSANMKDVESPSWSDVENRVLLNRLIRQSWEDVENMVLLNRLLRRIDDDNGLSPPPFGNTDPRDLERAVDFLKSWRTVGGGAPASLRHNQDFKLCKKIWFSWFLDCD